MARRRVRPPAEAMMCRFCDEGIGPGIRPFKDRHATPEECFKALKLARKNLRDCVRSLIASSDAKELRVIKTTFHVERADDDKLRWAIVVTDPLGDERRMALLTAHAWAAVYGSTAINIRREAIWTPDNLAGIPGAPTPAAAPAEAAPDAVRGEVTS